MFKYYVPRIFLGAVNFVETLISMGSLKRTTSIPTTGHEHSYTRGKGMSSWFPYGGPLAMT